MTSLHRTVTVLLLIQALALMIAELNGNYHNVPFEDMKRVSIWTGEYRDAESKQVFFSIDQNEDRLGEVSRKLEMMFTAPLNPVDGFSKYRALHQDFTDGKVFKNTSYQQSTSVSKEGWIIGHGFDVLFYSREIHQSPELKFQIIEKTLNHLKQLFEKKIVVDNLNPSNVYVVFHPFDIFVAQLSDYTEFQDYDSVVLEKFKKQMDAVLEMASLLFPDVIQAIEKSPEIGENGNRFSEKTFLIKLSADDQRRYINGADEKIDVEEKLVEFFKNTLKRTSGKNYQRYVINIRARHIKTETKFIYSISLAEYDPTANRRDTTKKMKREKLLKVL